MNITLTGGTGYIGSVVLERLVERGHTVTALVRSTTSATTVTAAGAEAVVIDFTDINALSAAFAAGDAVIHTATPGDETSSDFDRRIADAALRSLAGTTKPYIQTSGIWIWGNNADITETSLIDSPAVSAWHDPIEKEILAADINATVLAPAIVYGRAGSLEHLFIPADGATSVQLVGDGSQRWTTVNVDDLADLYVLVVEQGEGLGYLVAASGQNPTVAEIAKAGAHKAAVAPESAEASRTRLSAALADALLLDQAATGSYAKSLGWKPSRPSLIASLENRSNAS
ncbi:NAD-dependent epimerase/dehydratase family protein [Arthrobacter glacialis]|uniref:NAD(P)-binding domain-containing protein n=1 Tax=Arthrobacter glacialis TaxID=1664 RepID=A0A2S3ZSH4_ARTGL|nr:NAD-dependent epimerase/dehydratase family protein [Arthrobacter glacialis]POH72216.1 hypothetical protein CVS27_17150 [Arthrobacter glacialis]